MLGGGKYRMKRIIHNPTGEEWYAVIQNKCYHKKLKRVAYSRLINFWHITKGSTILYSFLPNEKYNRKTLCTKEICENLEKDLRSVNPSVRVLRFAVNGELIFSNGDHRGWSIPKVPDPFVIINEEERRISPKRLEIEKEKTREPAPYILYGKHNKKGKEYAWRLIPDKPKRQGILPGDKVIVWTRYGFTRITVTRIEKAEEQEQPTARVKKKLPSKKQHAV